MSVGKRNSGLFEGDDGCEESVPTVATGWGSWLSVILSETMLVATSAALVYVRLDDG